MSEEIAQPRREGDNPFKPSTENTNSADSQSGEQNGTETTPAPRGEDANNGAKDKKTPYNEDPRWREREDDWKKRFDTQESRHQEDLRKIREEFGSARNENAKQDKIPAWFGGNQEQWDSYRSHEDSRLKEAEDRAYKRVSEERTQQETTQRKLQEEATSYMQSELGAIESDSALNPTGAKIDVDKFLKYTVENKFIDVENNKWDYRKSWKYYQLEYPSKVVDNKERKNLARATTSESKPESKPSQFKTNKDFRQKKPW